MKTLSGSCFKSSFCEKQLAADFRFDKKGDWFSLEMMILKGLRFNLEKNLALEVSESNVYSFDSYNC